MNLLFIREDQERVDYFHSCLENSVHTYLDERESLLWQEMDIDLEVLKEVTALYRVLLRLCTDSGVKPMPDVLKRIVYLKRDIYQQHRAQLQRRKYTSRTYLTNPANFR